MIAQKMWEKIDFGVCKMVIFGYMNDNFGSDQYFYMRWKAADKSHSSISKINLHDRHHMYTHILPPPINVYEENNNSIFSVVLSNNFRIYFIHNIMTFFRITPCTRVCKWQASNSNDHCIRDQYPEMVITLLYAQY